MPSIAEGHAESAAQTLSPSPPRWRALCPPCRNATHVYPLPMPLPVKYGGISRMLPFSEKRSATTRRVALQNTRIAVRAPCIAPCPSTRHRSAPGDDTLTLGKCTLPASLRMPSIAEGQAESGCPNLIAFSTPPAHAMPSLPKRNACVSLCRCPSLLKSGGISRMLPFSKERSPFCALHAIIFFGASMRRTRTFCTFARQLVVVAPSGCSAPESWHSQARPGCENS